MQNWPNWLFRANFFSFWSAWIFAFAFKLRSETLLCILLLVCTLFLRKTRTKYRSVHSERIKAQQKVFSFVVLCIIVFGTRGIFFLFLLFFLKNSGTFERKKIHPKKSLRSVVFFSETRAQNNSQSLDNVRPRWLFVSTKFGFGSHFDWSHTWFPNN